MTSWRASWRTWRHRARRTVPSPGLIGLAGVVALSNFLLARWLFPNPWFWIVLCAVLLGITLYDLVDFSRLCITASRELPNRPQLRIPFVAAGSIQVSSPRFKLLEVDLGFVSPLVVQEKLKLSPAAEVSSQSGLRSATTVTYIQKVLATRRGLKQIAPMECRVRSGWGFWQSLIRLTPQQEMLVIPDITTWKKAVDALQNTLSEEGWHARKLLSGDSEFSHLADYVPGDNPRRINWAASARRGRLMKNVYQAEQGQQLIIAVDAGRYMQVEMNGGKTRLDYALESAAALSYAAMDAGDRVGVVAFTHRMIFRIPPGRGSFHWKSIVEHLTALEAEPAQGGYESLLRNLQGGFHRRSLLIVISELEGVESDTGFLPVLARTKHRHPTLFVTLADVAARGILEGTPAQPKDAARLAAAHMVLEERARTCRRMRRQGVSVIESLPGDAAVDAVAEYLRRRNRIAR